MAQFGDHLSIDQALLRQRMQELDQSLDELTFDRCPSPQERARLRLKLCAEYARVVKLLAEMAEA